jgi:hypothetical protein
LGKNKECLKAKIDELETNNKIKNIIDFYRCVVGFETSYQLRINIVKELKGVLVTDSHIILAICFSQLLNVVEVHNVRQTEIHTTEPLVPEPSAFYS